MFSMKRVIALLSISTISLASFAQADLSLVERLERLYSSGASKELKDNIKELAKRNTLSETRPAFCPLNNTTSYQKTVESLKSIVAVFQDDCFDGNKALIDQLLSSSKNLEEELSKIAKDSGNDPLIPEGEDKPIEVNGIPIGQFINGINVLFNNNKCTNLAKTPMLERSADIIQTFSQFGLYSPSGVVMAYGGLAVSSILRFISNVFDKRFEFEDDADIETFVKLNCAYYDVRNQVKSLEIFDIDTQRHFNDLQMAKDLLSELKLKAKLLEEDKKNVLKSFEEIQTKSVTNVEKELYELIFPLYEKIKNPVSDAPGRSALYQQAQIVGELSYIVDVLMNKLDSYIRESKGPERFINIIFKQKLEKLYHPESLMELSTKDFNDTFLKDLASSFQRVISSVEKKKEELKKNFDESQEFFILDKVISIKEAKEYIAGKALKAKQDEIEGATKVVSEIATRLSAIIAKKEYTSDDSQDGGIREIIKSLDTIRNFIYGKYGKQFIEKMRDLSRTQNKNFKKFYENIEENYLSDGKVVPKSDLYEDKILNACVDAATGREIWVYSQKLSELGYDFLSTNSDIFGDPNSNSDREKIKSHNDSAILARRIMNAKESGGPVKFYGKTFTIDEALEYLDKEYGAVGIRKDYIGNVMIEVVNNRDRALKLQELIKNYNCNSLSPFPK